MAKPPKNFISSTRIEVKRSLSRLSQGTSNMAETRALLYGLKWCVGRGYDSGLGRNRFPTLS
ncbi:hypothetical protein H5410_038104 [Solanum commersonii]|uniref:Uncharacterized protein n=1 Tax=Solanum commersonii TaxID=4109 RepID=A0A9J5YBD7_SOLCO|nr:hypothetical protein H5410_038104 [Solanum commersonii]